MSTTPSLPPVNTFLGSTGPANCIPGPYVPFGMVRLSPDTLPPHRTHGYWKGHPIQHFSHTHVAGTGGASRYGNVGILPFTGRPRLSEAPPYIQPTLRHKALFIPTEESGSVGYYHTEVPGAGFTAELTATAHAGIHRYHYTDGKDAWILLDGGAVLDTGLARNGHVLACEEWDFEGDCVGGYLERVSATEFIGRGDFRGGWGQAKPYSVFYIVRLSEPVKEITARYVRFGGEFRDGCTLYHPDLRMALGFGSIKEIVVKVGVSFTSIAQARADLDCEVGDRSFEQCREAAVEAWRPVLNTFTLEGGEEDQRVIFHSLLYRLFCMPTDLGVDQNNPLWKSGRRAFTDFYCLWDSIRNANTFFLLFFPDLAREMANSLLDAADHQGWLADAHIAHYPAYMQSACAADILFSEYALKGLGGIDYEKALRYLRKNAEVASPDPIVVGRYTEDLETLDYLSTNVEKSCVSRMIEYCYHDWCIGRLAGQLGDPETAADYQRRSQRVWNLWREDPGVFAPRRPDGSWHEPFDCFTTIKDRWNDPFAYEGTCFAWTFNVLHDMAGLARRWGGVEGFLAKLDEAYAKDLFQIKEVRMHMPHLYTLAGRPDVGGERVLEALAHFKNASNGIRDNEDMGVQSCFYLFNSMGIYPIYGQDLYVLTPPLFDKVSAPVGSDRRHLTIEVDRSRGGRFIVAATLNGQPLDRAWLRHAELLGAHLHLTLSDQAGSWGQQLSPMFEG